MSHQPHHLLCAIRGHLLAYYACVAALLAKWAKRQMNVIKGNLTLRRAT